MKYYWLPFEDKDWQLDMVRLAKSDDINSKILPFESGVAANACFGLTARAGDWREIKAGDQIFVVGHGHKYQTDKMSWKLKVPNPANPTGPTVPSSKTWSHIELALHLSAKLGLLKKQNLTIHIYACFSGNNITVFSKSLGSKVTKELKGHRFNGKVIGYKGAIGMLKARGHQTGSSRITAAPHFSRFGSGPDMRGKATTDAITSWII
ncbi:hypothetical protein AKG98_2700 [Moritella sp. JT01]|uniref:hypothetical protein n=1 Tax=Moritella sp. JT01 TaxID=756698 RepID=UPI000796D8FB|nr:hypothetical protein [Moritella sp. JT01]KXO07131.1 hypothetical protein AKG98_2700 [Moritella sp. JT01]